MVAGGIGGPVVGEAAVGEICAVLGSLSPSNYLAGKTSKNLCLPPRVLRTHQHPTLRGGGGN